MQGFTGTQNSEVAFSDNVKGWGGNDAKADLTTHWLLWQNAGTVVGGTFDSQLVKLSDNSEEVLVANFTVQTGASVTPPAPPAI